MQCESNIPRSGNVDYKCATPLAESKSQETKFTYLSLDPEEPELLSEMLDVLDFIADGGGDPQKVGESQRKRYADEGVVDEIIGLYEEARASRHSSSLRSISLTALPARYEASQIRTQINGTQKEIGQLKKVCHQPELGTSPKPWPDSGNRPNKTQRNHWHEKQN